MRQRQKKGKQRGKKVEGKKDDTVKSGLDKKEKLQQRRRGTEDGDRQTGPEMKHPAASAHVYPAFNSHPKWP